MDKVEYRGEIGEAVCNECGAIFAAGEFEAAKEHDESPCDIHE